ncbi:hypothetical protein [Arthrobacter antibioticus]|uniref:hypothetical protein n=1 Tax=Arthrobacter sp. H35-MC1 TaxID=3046203 RepID=UPI0024BB79AD|nr:hypothetical protein [Arthrobacter sp. H35-MC1]MDJ0316236.1 hypothetical protein [Arthrobacter sp. H35-MC1]
MSRRTLEGYTGIKQTTFSSIDTFEAAYSPTGVITIDYDGYPLDVLNVFRGAKTTLIVFHSSLNEKMQVLPVFSGQRLAEDHNMNLISLSDPSLCFDDSLNLAWFLGNRKQSLISDIPRIIGTIMKTHLGSKAIYFGSSGGGFAALLHSRLEHGAVAIVANPRIDLNARPKQDLGLYLRSCFRASGRTAGHRIMRENIVMNVSSLYKKNSENVIVYIQNVRDRYYLRDNMLQFVQSTSGNVNLNLLLSDFGVGHRPVPRQVLDGVISAVVKRNDSLEMNLSEIGFRNSPSLLTVDQWISDLLEEPLES